MTFNMQIRNFKIYKKVLSLFTAFNIALCPGIAKSQSNDSNVGKYIVSQYSDNQYKNTIMLNKNEIVKLLETKKENFKVVGDNYYFKFDNKQYVYNLTTGSIGEDGKRNAYNLEFYANALTKEMLLNNSPANHIITMLPSLGKEQDIGIMNYVLSDNMKINDGCVILSVFGKDLYPNGISNDPVDIQNIEACSIFADLLFGGKDTLRTIGGSSMGGVTSTAVLIDANCKINNYYGGQIFINSAPYKRKSVETDVLNVEDDILKKAYNNVDVIFYVTIDGWETSNYPAKDTDFYHVNNKLSLEKSFSVLSPFCKEINVVTNDPDLRIVILKLHLPNCNLVYAYDMKCAGHGISIDKEIFAYLGENNMFGRIKR